MEEWRKAAREMAEEMSEGWAAYCMIDNHESHCKKPARRDGIKEIEKTLARVMKR